MPELPELTQFAQSIAASVMDKLAAKGVGPADITTIMAVACCEVHCQIYGTAGLEKLRDAVDVCEKQLLGTLQ